MQKNFKKIIICFMALGLTHCGVKGFPVPPEAPPPLGRGQPTYKEAKKTTPLKKSKSEKVEESAQ